MPAAYFPPKTEQKTTELNMHYYQFNIGDYRRDTNHLSLLEHGIYRSLLDSYYLNEKPLCKDDATLMRTHCVKSEEEVKALENVLNDFFILTKKGYIHKKCEEQINKYNEKSQKARAAAEKRWNAKAIQKQCERITNHKPITNNHKPIKDTKKSAPSVAVDFSVFSLSDELVEEIKRIRVANKGGAIKTQRVANGLAKEFGKAQALGYDIEEILTEWEIRKWKSFKADWMSKTDKRQMPHLGKTTLPKSGHNLETIKDEDLF